MKSLYQKLREKQEKKIKDIIRQFEIQDNPIFIYRRDNEIIFIRNWKDEKRSFYDLFFALRNIINDLGVYELENPGFLEDNFFENMQNIDYLNFYINYFLSGLSKN